MAGGHGRRSWQATLWAKLAAMAEGARLASQRLWKPAAV